MSLLCPQWLASVQETVKLGDPVAYRGVVGSDYAPKNDLTDGKVVLLCTQTEHHVLLSVRQLVQRTSLCYPLKFIRHVAFLRIPAVVDEPWQLPKVINTVTTSLQPVQPVQYCSMR